MSLVTISMWVILGLVLGVGLTIALAGNSGSIDNALLRQILRSNRTGWALVQRGNEWSLDKLTRDEDTGAYRIGSESDAEWVTDPGDMMHSWHGVPVGLKLEEKRPMVDVQAAAASHEAAEASTDGGAITAEDTYTATDLQEKLVVGSMQAGNRVVQFINPFKRLPKDEFVDLRNITKLMRYDAGSDVPRKAAKNATEAERAVKGGYGDLKEFGKVLASFLMGAVAAYIGSSGGGGGGISVPIMMDAMAVMPL